MYFDLAHAPFGEVYANSGSTDAAFTGQRQDTVAGLSCPLAPRTTILGPNGPETQCQ